MSVNVMQATPVTKALPSDVALQLETLAPGLPLADHLIDLATTLRTLEHSQVGAKVRNWAAVDLFTVFLSDTNDPAAAGPDDRLSRVLNILTQVLVFVPIAWTWLGLALASSAYRAAIAAGAMGSESFLQGWQTGFDGHLLGLFAFNEMAIVTFAFVFVLIAVTAVHSWRNRSFEDHADQRRNELARALLQTDLMLARYRLPTDEQVAASIDNASAALSETVASIGAAGAAVTRTQEQANEAITAMASAVAATEHAVARVSSASKSLKAAAESLDKSPDLIAEKLDLIATAAARLASAERDLAKASGEASGRIADALRDGAYEVRDSVHTVGATAASYVTRTELAADILGQAQQSVLAMPDAVEALRTDVASMGAGLFGLTEALTTLDGLRRSVDALRRSLDAAQAASDVSSAAKDAGPAGTPVGTPRRATADTVATGSAATGPAGTLSYPETGAPASREAAEQARHGLFSRRDRD